MGRAVIATTKPLSSRSPRLPQSLTSACVFSSEAVLVDAAPSDVLSKPGITGGS